jgi:hypothetical protein
VHSEVEFLDASGERLGLYYEYLQVVPFTFNVRLGLSRSVVSPGEGLRFRLENLGTREMSYGLFFWLERFDKGRWTRVLDSGKVFSVAYGLHAGGAGYCERVRVPVDAPPGRYRVKKEFTWRDGPAREIYAVKNFWVRRG